MLPNVIDLGACRAARIRGQFVAPLPRLRLVADVGDLIELRDGRRGAVVGVDNDGAAGLRWTLDLAGEAVPVDRGQLGRNISTGAALCREEPPADYAERFEALL